MPVTPSGRKISIKAIRFCRKCGRSTHQVCHGIRYTKEKPESEVYRKECFWVCTVCLERTEESRELPEKTERLMLMERLIRLTEDYEFKNASIQSLGSKIIFTVQFPEVDMARLRRITSRFKEDGFIRVSELMELRKAGLHGPKSLPEKSIISADSLRRKMRKIAFT